MQVHSSTDAAKLYASQQTSSEKTFQNAIEALNMPSDVKEAFLSAMNTLGDGDRLMALSLTFDAAKLNSDLNGTSYEPTFMDYDYLKNRVDALLHPTNGAYTSDEAKESIQKFWSAFENVYGANATNGTASTQEDDTAVVDFLEKLRTKGALKFLADFNKEKIEKMVEEYKQKLLEEMGDSPEAKKEIETLVAAYKKQLLEELQNSLDADEKTTPINANAMIQAILGMQEREAQPLAKLLQNEHAKEVSAKRN